MTEPTRAALPYVVPMAGFVLLTAAEGLLPKGGSGPAPYWYPLAYAFKVAVVSALAWVCRSSWRDLSPRPKPSAVLAATAIGLAVAFLWVKLDGHYPELAFLGKRTAFDPHVLSPAGFWAFVLVRMVGLAVLVPLVEELFWRSFLMRWLIDPDFQKEPIGRVTPAAAAVTSVCFAFVHPEWLPGLITGFAWAWLLWRTKSVAACVVSHCVANLALGLYVLRFEDWKFW